jgi:hypothetical protein
MNIIPRIYRHARWRLSRAEACAKGVLLTGAGAALSRSIGVPTRQLRRELDTVWADVRRTHRARRRIAMMRSQGVLKSVDDLNMAARKRSSTVFVLGSGSSVNNLAAADWAAIREHDSIGFNLWLIRDFVPTFYFVELGTGSAEEDKYISDLLCRRLSGMNGMPVIVESKCWLRPDGVASDLPHELFGHLYFYAPYYLRTTSVNVVAWVLRHSRRFWHRGSCDLRAMVHHRASLSALVLFAFLAGYEEIVLVGVDLNDPRYFWETNPEILGGAAGPPFSQTGQVHRTVDPTATASEGAVPIDEYLRLLDSSVLRPNGVTLSVGSPRSRLSSFLPVYEGLSLGARGQSPSDTDETHS